MTGAAEYGKALFLLSEEDGRTERTREELTLLSALLKEAPEYTKLLDTPALPKAERLALIDEAFSDFSENLKNLIKILSENRCTNLLPAVISAFTECYNEAFGILFATAVTSIALTDGQIKSLTENLEAKTGKSVRLYNKVDPSILGGVVLQYADTQLDGSVKTRLDKFKEALSDIVI